MFVFAIGSFNSRLLRRDILLRLGLPPERFATLVHPGAKIYSSAIVGHGSIIHCGTVIGNGAVVGPFVICVWNSVIGANNLVGPGALVTSGVVTNSGVKIGSYSFIGSSSCIGEGVEVGPGAMVAMGSVVLRDVPAGVFQMGMPPRILNTEAVSGVVLTSWARMVETGVKELSASGIAEI